MLGLRCSTTDGAPDGRLRGPPEPLSSVEVLRCPQRPTDGPPLRGLSSVVVDARSNIVPTLFG
jgi:hypothetical protein